MRTLIIAEAGVNHNGSIELAKELIDVAANAGADIVKFQSFKADKLVTKEAKKAAYQQQNMPDDIQDTQYEMLKKLELSSKDHEVLIDYCENRGIDFLSTAFDEDGVRMLAGFGISRWKIPSGEITNLPYLKEIGAQQGEVILSTGMCTEEDIEKCIEVLLTAGTKMDNIIILHCNTEYPTPFKDVNLNAMKQLGKKFRVRVGYSDHTPGIEVPIAAVAMGAVVIEKHFTLDRNMEGPDHKASLEPGELKAMVSSIRNIELALGDGIKKPSVSEQKNITIARKSIHLNKDISKDTFITEDDLVMLRPGDGISPMEMYNIIGMKALQDMPRGTKLDYKSLAR